MDSHQWDKCLGGHLSWGNTWALWGWLVEGGEVVSEWLIPNPSLSCTRLEFAYWNLAWQWLGCDLIVISLALHVLRPGTLVSTLRLLILSGEQSGGIARLDIWCLLQHTTSRHTRIINKQIRMKISQPLTEKCTCCCTQIISVSNLQSQQQDTS